MINSIYQVNKTIYPVNATFQDSTSRPAFQAAGSDKIQPQNKKGHKVLAWLGGIAATIAVCVAVANPASRMRFFNLFKKQASEEVINNAIRKYAKEMSNLDKEKMIFLNPKTGGLIYSANGTKATVNHGKLGFKLLGNTLIGHNHPEQIIDNCHFNDTTFSCLDLFAGLIGESKHEFVVTQKNIHHIKYNGNYDDEKFLDYLVNNGIITLKDREPETIINEIRKRNIKFNGNLSTKAAMEKDLSQIKGICDHMGWTFWREPLAA